MQWRKSWCGLLAASLLIFAAQVQATTMLQMDLGELTTRAGKIFRGTLMVADQGTVQAGGGELPAVTYQFRVEELYKGEPTETRGEISMIEIRVIGTLDSGKPKKSGIAKFSKFGDVPQFKEGGEYLLFTTPESPIGLSVTVGLGQGAFKVLSVDGVDQAVNEFNNMGLGLNGDGPVDYEELSARIRALLGQ